MSKLNRDITPDLSFFTVTKNPEYIEKMCKQTNCNGNITISNNLQYELTQIPHEMAWSLVDEWVEDGLMLEKCPLKLEKISYYRPDDGTHLFHDHFLVSHERVKQGNDRTWGPEGNLLEIRLTGKRRGKIILENEQFRQKVKELLQLAQEIVERAND
jgi:hypothetical protein